MLAIMANYTPQAINAMIEHRKPNIGSTLRSWRRSFAEAAEIFRLEGRPRIMPAAFSAT
jgi:hypothetical protein